VGSAMLMLAEVITFSNWKFHMGRLNDRSPVASALCLIFVGVTSLGILNLVTGVIVQVAFHTVVGMNQTRLFHRLGKAKPELHDSIDRAFARDASRRARDKAALQGRVRQMRQAAFEAELLTTERERRRLATETGRDEETSRFGRMRRADNQRVATQDQLGRIAAGMLFDGGLGRGSRDKRPRSALDERNQCFITHAFWTAEGELCVGISSMEGRRGGRARCDPMRAVLLWDGGRTPAAAYEPDTAALEEAPMLARGSAASLEGVGVRSEWSGQVDAAASTRRAVHVGRIGDLFFTKVPAGVDLHFKYQSRYSAAPVFPVASPVAFDTEILVEHILPTDREVLTIRVLRELMQDPGFVKRLAAIGLRPEQALMTFSTLNVLCTGRVRVVDFIDGILRLRRQDLGLDTAGAKSVMRRLLVQVSQLASDATTCNMCFSNAVHRLRGVSVLEHEDHESDLSMVDAPEDLIEQIRAMACENESIKLKVSRMRRFVAAKKAALGIDGKLGFGRLVDDVDDDASSQAGSITSANLGWD